MSEKIAEHSVGDCVEVTVFDHHAEIGFFDAVQRIGLVLESELVEMDVNEGDGVHDEFEWMYRVSLPDGRVVEVWDYEIKHVNAA